VYAGVKTYLVELIADASSCGTMNETHNNHRGIWGAASGEAGGAASSEGGTWRGGRKQAGGGVRFCGANGPPTGGPEGASGCRPGRAGL